MPTFQKQTNKEKKKLSIERLLSDSLGFLGHVRRARAKLPLTPEVFKSSHLIEAYLDFLKVGFVQHRFSFGYFLLV